MSASLVGSEMCIRDRATAPPDPPKNTGGAHLGVSRGAVAPLERRRRKRAVSYTHLTLPTICSV
eukprot:2168573-Alexandrium_andersonii.AAC.1